jgi:hypothetical protein
MPTHFTRERRLAPRYRLRLPVIFHWDDGGAHTEDGFTVDIGRDGALISSSACPPVGAKVRVEVLFSSPMPATEDLRIYCTGTVTRVSQQAGTACFGLHGIFNDDQLTQHVSL